MMVTKHEWPVVEKRKFGAKKESLVPFEAPTSIFVVGMSGSDKSYLTRQILQHANGMFQKPTVRILFCYGVWQDL